MTEVLDRLARFRTPEAAAAVDRLSVRPTDVFVATYTKSGTTWMQQIVHQLRTRGSMDFDDVSVVVPWIEVALDVGIDPDADQAWEPRAFKTHLSWSQLPPGGRYITVFRDPVTVLPSFYRFFEGWFFEPGSITIEAFARALYLEGSRAGRHWHHLVDWWPRIGDDDVLALSYEDMILVPNDVPAVVADFLGIELDSAAMERVVANCSRATMAANDGKFDDHVLRFHRDPAMDLPPGGTSAKVNAEPSRAALTPELRAELDAMWAATVDAELGLSSYGEFRRALPNPLGVSRY